MLDPNANFQTAIAATNLKVAEIYDVTLSNGNTYYFTSHSQDIVWNVGDDVYTSLPIMRGPIQTNMNLEMDVVEIRLANISGDLYDILQNNTLNNIKVVIKRILWDETYAPDMEITYFVGIGDIEFDRQELVIHCRSILDSLNIQVPRNLFQEPCNYRLYDDNCSLTQADYEYQGTVTSGTKITLVDASRGTVYKGIFDDATNTLSIGDTITGGNNGYTAVIVQIVYSTATTGFVWYVELSNTANFEDDEVLTSGANDITLNGTPTTDTSFYAMGELKVNTGDNAGERRPILKDSGNTITLMWPLPNTLVLNDTYSIYPGCDKRAIVCEERFGNEANFRGFLYVPKVEDSLS